MTRNVLLILSCGFLVFLSPATAGGQTTKIPDGLHIPQGRQVNFNTGLTDGSGKQWQFQRYLSVNVGINRVYGNGLLCQDSGANVQSGTNKRRMNADGD